MEKLEFIINRTSAAEPFFLFSQHELRAQDKFCVRVCAVARSVSATLNNELPRNVVCI
jgi:hypothetical protein